MLPSGGVCCVAVFLPDNPPPHSAALGPELKNHVPIKASHVSRKSRSLSGNCNLCVSSCCFWSSEVFAALLHHKMKLWDAAS